MRTFFKFGNVFIIAFIISVYLDGRQCVQGQLLEYFKSLSPTSVAEDFRKLLASHRTKIRAEIEAHQAVVAFLEEMEHFSRQQEEKAAELANSITSFLFNVPSIYDNVKTLSYDVSGYAKRLDKLEAATDAARSQNFAAADEILQESRDTLKFLSAPPEDLPVGVYELLGPKRTTALAGGSMIGAGPGGRSEKELFDIGYELYQAEKWQEAYGVLFEAWRVYNLTVSLGMPIGLEEVFIVDHLQFAAHKLGKTAEAYWLCKRALSLPLMPQQQTHFRGWLNYHGQELLNQQVNTNVDDNVPQELQIEKAEELANSSHYEAHCHDDKALDAAKRIAALPEFFCRLDDRNRHPLLILSPVKEEILSLEPLVVMLYEIVTHKEMQALKILSNNKLRVAVVVSHDTQQSEIQKETRIAKTAWIDNNKMLELNRRIEAYTGLNSYADAAELYQVAHYNIGGHYIPHYDNLFDAANEQYGDRIATLLLYLNEVEKGGGTAFTQLGLRVSPTIGAGVFWYNIHKNDTHDVKTLHAACPVLRGEKWATNKWFYTRTQHLHQPCGLTQQETHSLQDLSLPLWLRDYYRDVNR